MESWLELLTSISPIYWVLLVLVIIVGNICFFNFLRDLFTKPNFRGKVVFITGANSGIGEHMSYYFNSYGARVIISGRKIKELERVKKASKYPDQVEIFQLSLDDPEEVAYSVTNFAKKIPKIDIVINNAGVSVRALIEDTSLEACERILRINLLSTIAITKAFLPMMKMQRSGHIAVTSSIAGLVGNPVRGIYSASKHAVQGFYNALRAEMMGDGSKFGKTDGDIAKGIKAEECGRQCAMAIYKNKKEHWIAPLHIKIFIPLMQIFPSLQSFVMNKKFKTNLKHS